MPESTYEMVVIDSIEPPSGPHKFKHVLCILDSFSRFCGAYLVLIHREICMPSLVRIYSLAGVSSFVISDNATNVNNALTEDLINRMRFSWI